MASHGGAMTVVAVEGDTVRLRGDGACTGCRQSDETIVGIISPALRAAYPEIAEVILDADARQPAQQQGERSSLPTAGRVSWSSVAAAKVGAGPATEITGERCGCR